MVRRGGTQHRSRLASKAREERELTVAVSLFCAARPLRPHRLRSSVPIPVLVLVAHCRSRRRRDWRSPRVFRSFCLERVEPTTPSCRAIAIPSPVMRHRFLVDLALKLVLVPVGIAAPRPTTDRVGRVERLLRVPGPVLEQSAPKLFLAAAGRGRADWSDLRSGVELLVREWVEFGFGATPCRGTVIVPSEQVVVVVSEPTTLGAVQAVVVGTTAFDFVLVDIVVPRCEGVPLRPAAAAKRLFALRFRAAAVPSLGPDRVVVSSTDTL